MGAFGQSAIRFFSITAEFLHFDWLISLTIRKQTHIYNSCNVKVHLTADIFFTNNDAAYFWSSLPEKFFDLVKSSIFHVSSKHVKMPPSWFVTEGQR